MSLTYNQIISLNRSFVNAHHVLKNFGNGMSPEIVLHNQEEAYRYPLCWAEDLPNIIAPGRENTSFRFYFLAPVEMLDSADTNNVDSPSLSDNINEVKSNMKQCAQDLLSYWAQQHEYPKFKIEQSTSINFVEDTTFDSLYGCWVDVNFYQAFSWNTCAIPMGTPTPLPDSCSPGFVYANDTLVFQVSSGGKYYFTIVDEEGETINYVWDADQQKFTIPSMGAGIDIYVNGMPFYVGQSSDVDLPVKDSLGTNSVGSKIGSNWIIGDGTVHLKNSDGDTFANVSVKAEEDKNHTVGDGVVQILDSETTVLYTKLVKAQGNANQIITDSTVNLKDAVGNTLFSVTAKAQETKNQTLPIAYVRDGWTVKNGSFLTRDLGWYLANTSEFSYSVNGLTPILNPADVTKLVTYNYFGNLNRVTNSLGGTVYNGSDGSISGYAIDHYTGLGYYLSLAVGSSTSWQDSVTAVLAGSFAGLTGWRMLTVSEFEQISYGNTSTIFDSIESWGLTVFWTMCSFSETQVIIVRQTSDYSSTRRQAFSTAANASVGTIVVRKHF